MVQLELLESDPIRFRIVELQPFYPEPTEVISLTFIVPEYAPNLNNCIVYPVSFIKQKPDSPSAQYSVWGIHSILLDTICRRRRRRSAGAFFRGICILRGPMDRTRAKAKTAEGSPG